MLGKGGKLFTYHECSMKEDNVFSSVCDSVHRLGGGGVPGLPHPVRGVWRCPGLTHCPGGGGRVKGREIPWSSSPCLGRRRVPCPGDPTAPPPPPVIMVMGGCLVWNFLSTNSLFFKKMP